MDREKVFDAFRNCITEPKCKDCPWETCEEFHQTKKIPLDLCLDILELLKELEAEAVTPIITEEDDLYWQPGDEDYACGSCGETLAGNWWKYCPYCGRKVKWSK